MPLADSALLAARHQRIRGALEALHLEALIVTTPANLRYLTNHTGTAGTAVVTASAVHLLVDFRYDEAVRALQASSSACPGLERWPVPASYDEALAACLAEIGTTAVGFEAGHLTVARHHWLTATLAARAPEITLRSTERVVEESRLVKDAFEISMLREAASRLAAVADAAFAAARPGTRERDVAAAIELAMRQAGYERPAFETIVASGPNAALPHHRAGGRSLADGDVVVLDFGGVLDGYCCDLTRTVSIGRPSEKARQVYDAVLEAQRAALAAIRPGVEAADVDAAARRALEARGLGDAFGHGTGHGLGLDVHEDPRITRPRGDAVPVLLQPGMVFTVEPGAYLAGWGGVRIEDDVLVTGQGHEVLTAVPRDLATLRG